MKASFKNYKSCGGHACSKAFVVNTEMPPPAAVRPSCALLRAVHLSSSTVYRDVPWTPPGRVADVLLLSVHSE